MELGVELELGKNIKYRATFSNFTSVSYACAIPDPDKEEVIITGGGWSLTTVSVYSEAGWQRDMTPLNQRRQRHCCSSFLSEGERVRTGE